jgi:5-methyltetrahydrofolate--homocysteine methyltransferase
MNRYDDLTNSVNAPIILDGALGTMLIQRGLKQGTPPETWNLEHEEVVRDIHTAYFNAGSHIVHTNSFGATRLRLTDFGLADKTEELNVRAVEIAQK